MRSRAAAAAPQFDQSTTDKHALPRSRRRFRTMSGHMCGTARNRHGFRRIVTQIPVPNPSPATFPQERIPA